MKGTDWLSERVLFGLLIIVGYFALVGLGMAVPMSDDQRQTAHDGLLVVGPILGLIAQAIWKSDKADKSNAEAISNLSTALSASVSQPSAPVPAASAPVPSRPAPSPATPPGFITPP